MGATLRSGRGGGDLRTGGASLADPVWRPLGHKSSAAAAPEASALSRYRPEVDGLRALAVLPVILFHAGFAPFAGGFVGVDVFFVISGYLIAGLLAADLAAGRFSILRFYERRARRLLPALAVVILACLPFALAWMPLEHLRAFARSLAAVALFVSNLWFWHESGYFDAAADLKPLLHSWSLAVEEQFYLLFPPVLAGLWWLGRRLRRPGLARALVLAALAVGALLSLALCEWAWRHHPDANFFLAPTRAWELFAGALLALWQRRSMAAAAAPRAGPGAWRELGGIAGLAMILAAIGLFDAATPFPSLWTLLPVGGTVLVLGCASTGTLAARLLAWPPLLGVGLISYSAYLWHQPLFAFARLRSLDTPGTGALLGLSALALVLAWLTWRFVETPFRVSGPALARHRVLLTRRGALFSTAAICLAGLLLVSLVLPRVQARFFSPPLLPVLAEWQDRSPCLITRAAAARIAACQDSVAPGAKLAFLVGDSHAMAISLALRTALAAKGYHLVSFAHPACYPIPGTTRLPEVGSAGCRSLTDLAWQTFDTEPAAPVFVFTRWALNHDGRRFDNGLGGVESGPTGATFVRGATPGDEAARRAGLEAQSLVVLSELAATRPVLLLGPFPEAGWDVPLLWAKRVRFGAEAAPEIGIAAATVRQRFAPLDGFFAGLGVVPGLTLVPLEPLFCDPAPAGRCRQAAAGRIYYRDDDHPAPDAAAIIAAAATAALPGRLAGRIDLTGEDERQSGSD